MSERLLSTWNNWQQQKRFLSVEIITSSHFEYILLKLSSKCTLYCIPFYPLRTMCCLRKLPSLCMNWHQMQTQIYWIVTFLVREVGSKTKVPTPMVSCFDTTRIVSMKRCKTSINKTQVMNITGPLLQYPLLILINCIQECSVLKTLWTVAMFYVQLVCTCLSLQVVSIATLNKEHWESLTPCSNFAKICSSH